MKEIFLIVAVFFTLSGIVIMLNAPTVLFVIIGAITSFTGAYYFWRYTE